MKNQTQDHIFWWDWLTLAAIVALGAFFRFYNLQYPEFYMFDEVYHVPTAKLLAMGDVRALEWWHGELSIDQEFQGAGQLNETQEGTYIDWLHPPLHKYWQALNMYLFGMDNPISWRLSAVISGLAVIVFVYLIAREIDPQFGKFWGLLASLIVAVDPMLITQSKIGMNDMAITMWVLIGVWIWLKWLKNATWKNLIAMAIAFGLALATKWSAALPLALVGAISLFNSKIKFSRRFGQLSVMGMIVISIYLLVYFPYALAGKTWSDFFELHNQIWIYQNTVTAGDSPTSPAYSWPLGMEKVDYAYAGDNYPAVTLQGSPIFMLSGLLAIIAGFIISLHHKNPDLLLMVLFYFIFWVPWIFSPRPMFLYHYIPAMPFMYIVLADMIWLFLDKAIPEEKDDRSQLPTTNK